jgi:hypothetical protein
MSNQATWIYQVSLDNGYARVERPPVMSKDDVDDLEHLLTGIIRQARRQVEKTQPVKPEPGKLIGITT